jgi:muramidase (phage lysozyme)
MRHEVIKRYFGSAVSFGDNKIMYADFSSPKLSAKERERAYYVALHERGHLQNFTAGALPEERGTAVKLLQDHAILGDANGEYKLQKARYDYSPAKRVVPATQHPGSAFSTFKAGEVYSMRQLDRLKDIDNIKDKISSAKLSSELKAKLLKKYDDYNDNPISSLSEEFSATRKAFEESVIDSKEGKNALRAGLRSHVLNRIRKEKTEYSLSDSSLEEAMTFAFKEKLMKIPELPRDLSGRGYEFDLDTLKKRKEPSFDLEKSWEGLFLENPIRLFASGGHVSRFGDGGSVFGAGTATSDSIPAMLSHGEFVVNARAANQYRPLLKKLNSGNISFLSKGSPSPEIENTIDRIALSIDPEKRLDAFIESIAGLEGTLRHGFRTGFGVDKRITSLDDHPLKSIPTWRKNPDDTLALMPNGKPETTSAAGILQFMRDTWVPIKTKLALPDFSPESQIKAGEELFKQQSVLTQINEGKWAEALTTLGKKNIFTSIPSSTYGQPTQTWEKTVDYVASAAKNIKDGTSIVANRVADTGAEYYSTGKKYIKNTVDTTVPGNVTFMSEVKLILKALKDGLGDLKDEAVKKFSGAVKVKDNEPYGLPIDLKNPDTLYDRIRRVELNPTGDIEIATAQINEAFKDIAKINISASNLKSADTEDVKRLIDYIDSWHSFSKRTDFISKKMAAEYKEAAERMMTELKNKTEGVFAKTFEKFKLSSEAKQVGIKSAQDVEEEFTSALQSTLSGTNKDKNVWRSLADSFAKKITDNFVKGFTKELFDRFDLGSLFRTLLGGVYDTGKGVAAVGKTVAANTDSVDGISGGLFNASVKEFGMYVQVMAGGVGVGMGVGTSFSTAKSYLDAGGDVQPNADPDLAGGISGADLVGDTVAKAKTAISSSLSGLPGMLSGLMGMMKEGLLTAFTFVKGLFMADGGYVSGPGSATSDSIAANLSNGEFVVNARATAKHLSLLQGINSGNIPRFASGGLVGNDISLLKSSSDTIASATSKTKSKASNSSVFNINITGDVSRQTRSEIQRMIPVIAGGVNQHNYESGYTAR